MPSGGSFRPRRGRKCDINRIAIRTTVPRAIKPVVNTCCLQTLRGTEPAPVGLPRQAKVHRRSKPSVSFEEALTSSVSGEASASPFSLAKPKRFAASSVTINPSRGFPSKRPFLTREGDRVSRSRGGIQAPALRLGQPHRFSAHFLAPGPHPIHSGPTRSPRAPEPEDIR